MSLKRPFVPKSDVKQRFTTTTVRWAYNKLIQLNRLGKQNLVILKPSLPINGNITFLFYNPKLRTYKTFKLTFHIEPYLLLLNNVKEVSALARFRLSSHSLQIELGRYNNTPLNNRLCTRCDYNAVDDEEHFLIHCSYFNEEKKCFISRSK